MLPERVVFAGLYSPVLAKLTLPLWSFMLGVHLWKWIEIFLLTLKAKWIAFYFICLTVGFKRPTPTKCIKVDTEHFWDIKANFH